MCKFFFDFYITVLCKQSSYPDALNGILHIRIYVQVDFIHNHFFFHYFLIYTEFIFHRKPQRYLVI